MPDTVIEADIEQGRIIPKRPEMLPQTGKALITILGSESKPDWDKIMPLLGTMKHKLDGVTVQRESRAGWAERERKQWSKR